MAEPRIIKRYANRKLYDTAQSRYVTLEQIAEMVRAGEEVRILDNTTKEDLTSVTLAQIIVEEEKRKKSFLPLHAMRDLIQSKGASIQEFVMQAGDRVRSALRFEKAQQEKQTENEGPREIVDEGTEGGRGDPSQFVRVFLEASQKAFEEWQRRMDERIRQAVEAFSPLGSIQREVQMLAARIEELERRIQEQERAEGIQAAGEEGDRGKGEDADPVL